MKDKEWNAKKKVVLNLFNRWEEDLGLRWYKITHEWKAGDGGNRSDGFTRVMEVQSRWEYRTATITIWLEELPDDEQEIEKIVVHELCHILVKPMRQLESSQEEDKHLMEKEEYTVECLASAFLWVRESGNKK